MKIAKNAIVSLAIIAVLGLMLGILAPLVINSLTSKENNTGWVEIPPPEAYEGDGPCLVWNGGGVWCH